MKTKPLLLIATLVVGVLGGCGSVIGLEPLVYDEEAVTTGTGDGGLDLDGSAASAAPDAAPPLRLSDGALDFGIVPCGAAAPESRTIQVTNSGARSVRWMATLDDETSTFALGEPTSGALEPGATATLTVTAGPPTGDDRPGETKPATLHIATDDALVAPLDVPVTLTPGGGVLEATPSEIAFGNVPDTGVAADIPVTLRNTGNLPLVVELGDPSDVQFSLKWGVSATRGATLAPGEAIPNLVASFRWSGLGASPIAKATARLTVIGATCSAQLESLTLTAMRSGGVGVQPGSLSFGTVECGSHAAEQTVLVTNASPNEVTIEKVGLAKNRFTLHHTSDILRRGESMTITVTPKTISQSGGIGASLYDDTLLIETNAPGDSTHEVPLKMGAKGVVLAVTPASIAWGAVAANAGASAKPFTVKNNGNVATKVTMTAKGAWFNVAPASASVGASTSAKVNAKCNPTPDGAATRNGSIAFAVDKAICKPLPEVLLECTRK